MATITPPRTGIPIGTLEINRVQYEVTTHPEFMRFFESLVVRAGGVTGASSADLSLSQFEDAGIPENFQRMVQIADEFGQAPPASDLSASMDAFWQLPPTSVQAAEEASGEVAALREEINALRQAVQALQQGLSA